MTEPSPSASRHSLSPGEHGGFGEAAARLSGAASLLLGWRPGEFWSATPIEMATALSLQGAAEEPADRTTLDELRRRFPDQ